MAANPQRQGPPKPTPEQWLSIKPDIEDLYVHQECKLSDVADILRRQRGFIATERMYKSRIKEWSLDQKTIREPDWRFMLQEHIRRKTSSTPKDTVFAIREDRSGRIAKHKTIRDIRNYLRRKRVSEDTFLSTPSDASNFPHIRSITPPLSPEPSPGPVSPESQMRDHSSDEQSPSSLSEVSTSTVGRPAPPPWPNMSLSRAPPAFYNSSLQASSIGNHASVGSHATMQALQSRPSVPPLSTAATSWRGNPQANPIFGGPRAEVSNSLAHRIEAETRQTLVPDIYWEAKEPQVYRLMAGPPSPPSPPGSVTSHSGEGFSNGELAEAFRRLDADLEDGEGRIRDISLSTTTAIASSALHLFKPDTDQALAFRWASRYFFACISRNQGDTVLSNVSMDDAKRLFWCMLKSDTRSPSPKNSKEYIPSHRSRFILSGLSLMYTVLTAHGRHDMLERFLLDSRRTIDEFFREEHHPLSIPYSYLLAVLKTENIDDEEWERQLYQAQYKITHSWGSESPNALVSQYYWAWHILKRKRYPQALQQLTACLEKAANLFGPCHIITVNCLSTIARALFEQNRDDPAAIPQLVDAIDRSRYALSSDEHPFRFLLKERLGIIHQEKGELDRAEAILVEVVNGRKKSLGLDHPDTLMARHKLEVILHTQGKKEDIIKLRADLDREWNAREELRIEKDHPEQPFPLLPVKTLIELH